DRTLHIGHKYGEGTGGVPLQPEQVSVAAQLPVTEARVEPWLADQQNGARCEPPGRLRQPLVIRRPLPGDLYRVLREVPQREGRPQTLFEVFLEIPAGAGQDRRDLLRGDIKIIEELPPVRAFVEAKAQKALAAVEPEVLR